MLLSQPAQIQLTYQNRVLYLTHASSDFIGDGEYRSWGTGQVARRYGDSQRPYSVPTWEQAFAQWEKTDGA